MTCHLRFWLVASTHDRKAKHGPEGHVELVGAVFPRPPMEIFSIRILLLFMMERKLKFSGELVNPRLSFGSATKGPT